MFSFVGRKRLTPGPPSASAPFRVAPPSFLFLNNHYCWPLFNPSTASSSGGAGGDGGTASSSSSEELGRAAALAATTAGSISPLFSGGANTAGAAAAPPPPAAAQAQATLRIATPQLAPEQAPRKLLLEYLPVEFTPSADDPALFSKAVTQFYFK